MTRYIVLQSSQEWPEMGKVGDYSRLLDLYFAHEQDKLPWTYYIVQLDTGELLSWDAVELQISRKILISIIAKNGIPDNIPSDKAAYLLTRHSLIDDNGVITEDGNQLLAEG